MLHRIKDLFQVQNDGRLLNCAKLGVYIPKDFVQSRRFPIGEMISQQMLNEMGESRDNLNFSSFLNHFKIRQIELFSEIFLAVFAESLLIVAFNKTSRVVAKFDMSQFRIDEDRRIRSLEFAIFPRLEWSDRYYDIQQQNAKQMPNKLVVAGTDTESCSFVLIYDRVKQSPVAVYIFEEEKGKITSIKYGPYDNGHIVVGFSTGIVAILESISLTKLFDKQIFASGAGTVGITFDPTNLVIATAADGETVAISLVENKVKYTYIELGQGQFCTVQQPSNVD